MEELRKLGAAFDKLIDEEQARPTKPEGKPRRHEVRQQATGNRQQATGNDRAAATRPQGPPAQPSGNRQRATGDDRHRPKSDGPDSRGRTDGHDSRGLAHAAGDDRHGTESDGHGLQGLMGAAVSREPASEGLTGVGDERQGPASQGPGSQGLGTTMRVAHAEASRRDLAELLGEEDEEEVDEDAGVSRGAGSDVQPSPAVIAQIRELEARLDRLIDEASRTDLSELDDDDDDDDDATEPVTLDAPPMVEEDQAHVETQPFPIVPPPEDTPRSVPMPRLSERLSTNSLQSEKAVFDTARELLSSDFYLRKWGRLAMRGRSEEVDDFGFDPIYEQKARSVFEFLYTKYFRVETSGIENVPAFGRCLLVANHSGTLPFDGVMLKTAVKLEHSSPRDLRWLTEDFIYHMPFLGSIVNRLGAVRACQENAERLLAKEELVAVFPEGVKGIGKLFSERYRLQRFGRGGFIKLCLRTNTPIVPVAIVGAEETNPLLFKIEYLSKALGVPYVPVTPTFPALGPLGLLPAPTKWQIHFGEPIELSGHGRDAADDDVIVGKLAERVRATIQGMLDRAVGSRKSVFFG